MSTKPSVTDEERGRAEAIFDACRKQGVGTPEHFARAAKAMADIIKKMRSDPEYQEVARQLREEMSRD